MLAGCMLSHDEFLELQQRLRDTSDLEDSSAPTEEETSEVEEEDSSAPASEETTQGSTSYALFQDGGCIQFGSENTALTSSSWGFSFRLTEELFTESKPLNMFQVGDSRIVLLTEGFHGFIFFCSPVERRDLGLEDFCHQMEIDFGTRSLAPQDRLTLSFKSEQKLELFHNAESIALTEHSSNFFWEGEVSFGCSPSSQTDLFSSWEGGIDSLILFNRHVNALEVRAVIDAELNNDLETIMDSENSNFFESYWNLGEDEDGKVLDSIGENHGQSNGNVLFLPYEE